eukprot:TRINITY_DN5778_c0_g2_i1.p1 TRINITY_DN5778_c0_g2~~TRINITY_DN5778_c0_g2_i1.p1  ORF type:complete len:183 (+),score=30.90 TRINITY_DN5778_c0_g2_i1:246-794(+)
MDAEWSDVGDDETVWMSMSKEGNTQIRPAAEDEDEVDLSDSGLTSYRSFLKTRAESQWQIVTVLDISYNRVESLPRCLFYLMTNLVVLNASENQIRCVSAAISNLQQLEQLSLSGNPLRWLPAEITEMHSLCALDVHGLAWAEETPTNTESFIPALVDLALTSCLQIYQPLQVGILFRWVTR